jgi:hypothetical protein
MATTTLKRLAGVAIPGTGALTLVYKCPPGKRADVNINFANSLDSNTDFRLVHMSNDLVANAADGDFLIGGPTIGLPTSSFAHNLAPGGFKAIAMTAGDELGVSSSANVSSAIVHGLEEEELP